MPELVVLALLATETCAPMMSRIEFDPFVTLKGLGACLAVRSAPVTVIVGVVPLHVPLVFARLELTYLLLAR